MTKKRAKREKKREIKIGLALGKGTARGFAHIGVLKALEKANIKISIISGCSAGAAIGGLYASGMDAKIIEKSLTKINWKEMFDFGIPKEGLIHGNKFENYLELLTQNKEFKHLDIPLYIIATNLTKRKRAIFSEGNIAKAIRASIALPGIFDPVKIDDDDYVDGGLVDPVPINILREKGANIIIAVDLTSEVKQMIVPGKDVKSRKDFIDIVKEKMIFAEVDFFKEFLKAKDLAKKFIPKILRNLVRKIKVFIIDKFIKPALIYRYVSKSKVPKILSMMYTSLSIMENEFTKTKLECENIDLIIRPTFTKADWTDFDKAKYFIRRGEIAAQSKIPTIKKLIKQAKSLH